MFHSFFANLLLFETHHPKLHAKSRSEETGVQRHGESRPASVLGLKSNEFTQTPHALQVASVIEERRHFKRDDWG
jgi:hypothetical protein